MPPEAIETVLGETTPSAPFGEEESVSKIDTLPEEEKALQTGEEETELVFEEEEEAPKKSAKQPEVVSEERTRIRELEKEIFQLASELKTLKSGPQPTKEEQLSREQIKQRLSIYLNENKDNPAALMEVLDYYGNYLTNEKAQQVLGDVDVAQKKKKIETITDNQLARFQNADDPKFQKSLDRISEEFMLTGHPAGRLFGLALMQLAEMEDAENKKSAEATRTEKLQKEKGSDTKGKLGKEGGQKSLGLDQDELDFCEAQGIKPEVYAAEVRRLRKLEGAKR